MIFQEMSLVPTLTVAQNMFLNREVTRRRRPDRRRDGERRARKLFAEMGVDIDPNAKVADIGAGQRQLTEIVKATSRTLQGTRVRRANHGAVRERGRTPLRLCPSAEGQGVAIVYVSHRMDEIFRIADRATILRDGRHVITAPLSEFTLESMIEHIVGRRSSGFSEWCARRRRSASRCLARGVSGASKPAGLDLELRIAARWWASPACWAAAASRWRACSCGIDPMTAGEIRDRGQAGRDRQTRRTRFAQASRSSRRIAAVRGSSHTIPSRQHRSAESRPAHAGGLDRFGKVGSLADSPIQRLRIKTDGRKAQCARCPAATRRKSS